MMKKMLSAALLALCFIQAVQTVQATENLYEQHYKVQNGGNLKSMQAKPDTKMYVSNHHDEDNIHQTFVRTNFVLITSIFVYVW